MLLFFNVGFFNVFQVEIQIQYYLLTMKFYYILAYALNTGVQRYPTCIYLLKVNNGKTRTMCETCSELKVKTFCLFSHEVHIYSPPLPTQGRQREAMVSPLFLKSYFARDIFLEIHSRSFSKASKTFLVPALPEFRRGH